MTAGKIIRVAEGSLAEEIELSAGDRILEINGQPLRDIIDLSFALAEEEIEMLVEHENGGQELLSFEKDYDEELGAEFESAVFDGIRCCANNCCFCFVDQVPADMRSSLYVKDDDYRLSFLYGNFVTMTNMVAADFERIKKYHLSPLFVSVHTMNMELRERMLRCKRAGGLLEQLAALEAAEVEYHTQVVLCPGINDGAELYYTIAEMVKHRPFVRSMAIVPVGLTKFRAGCCELHSFDRRGAAAVIDQVEKWQKELREKTGEGFVYLGDEFYLTAGREIPPADEYDGFPQLDNGIGLVRNFIGEWEMAAGDDGPGYDEPTAITVVTGEAFATVLKKMTDSLSVKNLTVNILPVENRFFGTMVNVSGLLTGKDILEALQSNKAKCDGVILPECALRSGENIFLDDLRLEELTGRLECPAELALSGDRVRFLLTHWKETDREARERTEYMWQSNAAYTKLF